MVTVSTSPSRALVLSVAILLSVPLPVKISCAKSIRGGGPPSLALTLVEYAVELHKFNVGQDVNIVCPFAHPLWYHDEKSLEANASLRIENITQEDAGVYSCVQENEKSGDTKWSNLTLIVCSDFCDIEFVTERTEASVRQNMNHMSAANNSRNSNEGLPKFKGNQLYQTIERHSAGSALFNCVPSMNTEANITWTFNDILIDTSLTKAKLKKWALSITDLEPRDSGTYTCGLCNTLGCVYRSTYLRVVERGSSPPVISGGTPANQSVNISDNAAFECDVASDLEPHIVWFQHNAGLNYTTDSFSLLNNPNVRQMITRLDEPHILRLGSVQKEDEGWYTCVAANALGETVASAFLNVLDYNTSHSYDNHNSSSSEQELVLNTLNLEQQDNDESLDHDVETKTNDTEEKPPKFKNVLKLVDQLHQPSGSSLQLKCLSTGNPIPNITWTRNDTEIERHIGKVTYKTWSIQMDDAITKDSGIYKCRICNLLGCIEHSTKVTIFDRLRSKPIISDKFPQNQTVLTNSSATLECRVVSDLEPYIFWLTYNRKNESIDELEKLAQNFADHRNANKSIGMPIVVLQRDPDKPNIQSFVNVTHDDEGWYTCVAASSLGATVASAYLKVVDKLPQRDGLQRNHPVWMTTVGVVVVLLFLLGTVFIIYVLRNLKHEKLLKQRIETVHQWTKKVIIYKPPAAEGSSCDLQMPVIKIEKQRTTFTTLSNSDPTQGFNEYEFPLDSNWEIPRNQLSLGSTLGEGAFGRVVMADGSGFPRFPCNGAATTIVAVKMVKEEHTDADMASLVREMEVMKMIGKHINIINLLGCCSQNGPLWVIVEFAPHGNLKDFLKKNRPLSGWGSCSLKRNSDYLEEKQYLTEKHLISFAFQIARGMEYLASRRCIHRDLAARNVLVSDDYVMKIADFGLARDIQDTDYYRKNTNGRLPIKWMAPESLQEKFYDSQSDVWSYGILLWETMTYGEQPYPNIMSAEELYSYLITGQRMEKPHRCSLNIYMLMRQCWHFDSNARPTFSEIVENLDKILQLSSTTPNEEYLDLSMSMLETPPSSSDEECGSETFRESSSPRYQYTYKFN